MTDDQLSALLRVKRHEQPPPGYYDELLRNVHRRQREDMLRQPLWRIALERMQTFFGEHSMGPLSYASAMAAIVVAGVLGVSMLESGGPSLVAAGDATPTPSATHEPTPPEAPTRNLRLAQAPIRPLLKEIPVSLSQTQSAPRYVIDTRPPASPQQTFSF
jgi:hypothetical protein